MLAERCKREIIELHQFFETWFTAGTAKSRENFDRFAAVLADEFCLVFPDGELQERSAILDRVFESHGMHRDNPRYFRIWTEHFTCRFEQSGLCLVTYEEWHENNGRVSARLSTGLFRARDAAVNGVEWVHVHEVWLPGRGTRIEPGKAAP